MITRILSLCALSCVLSGLHAEAWSSKPDRNPVFQASNLPETLTDEQQVWKVRLKKGQFAVPSVWRDTVLLGGHQMGLQQRDLMMCNREQSGASLIQVDAASGELRWELLLPGLGRFHSYGDFGLCNTPAIDGDRAYLVDPAGGVICVDLHGQTNGNDGPFTDELAYMANTGATIIGRTAKDRTICEETLASFNGAYGDVVWRTEILQRFQLAWKHCHSGTIIVDGDLLYVPTSNSRKGLALHEEAIYLGYSRPKDLPKAHAYGQNQPDILVLNKHTGAVVGRDAGSERKVGHGQWSTPCLIEVDGQRLLVYASGDEIVTAYKALPQSAADNTEPAILEEAWTFNPIPEEYHGAPDGPVNNYRGGVAERSDTLFSCQVMSAITAHEGRLYFPIGRDPARPTCRGVLWCLDAATGQVVWSDKQVWSSIVVPAVVGDRLYHVDQAGDVHCMNADTGARIWTQNLDADSFYCAPVVADGKLYVSSEKETLVLATGDEPKILGRTRRLGNEARSVAVMDGMVFIPSESGLFAYGQ